MFEAINNSIEQNKKQFNIEGQKFYYSRFITTFLLFSNSFLFISSFISIFTLGTHYLPGAILGMIIPIHILTIYILPKHIYKNPVFIIQNKKLFYTPTESWYELDADGILFMRRLNSNFRYFTIMRNNKEVVSESFLYVKDADDFKRQIGFIKKNHDYDTYK